MRTLTVSLLAVLALASPLGQAAGDPAAGKEKAASCVACHGENGVSVLPIYPHIGGQYADYLAHSLRAYQTGERQNAIMQGMVVTLSAQDIADLAAYFASQDGVLKEGRTDP